MARGRFLRLFIGNMASGKTRHLLTEIDTLRRYGNKKIAVFKPRTDTRSGFNRIKSRKGDEDSAEEISSARPHELWPILRTKESEIGCRFEVIAFDEVQFFPRDSGFYQLVKQLLDGSRAAYPQRLISGMPAHYRSPQIQVGGDETYEPRCDEHFVLPGRPVSGYDEDPAQELIWSRDPEPVLKQGE
jgi:thymidine kinase